ncbi:MAG: hypothetical protein JW852_05535 [Spirochaetales bacterium]|nr:hypothetical protein [Spirochaetales bacterium]
MTGKALFERIFSNWIVKVLSLAAAVVLFLFQRVGSLEERFLGVPLQYKVDERFVVTSVSAESVRIDIRGSGDEIFLVLADDIEAYIDLTSYTSEGIFRAPVLLATKGSVHTVDVEMIVEPLAVTATLERKMEKEVEIVPRLLGYPSVGYELVRYLVNPEKMQVTGPRSSLENLERLETAEIDLAGRRADFTVSVSVERDDELIVFSAGPEVEIRGFIREIIIEKTFETVPIEYINLPARLQVEQAALFGSVALSGPQLQLESLRALDLRLEVNCSAIGAPGVYDDLSVSVSPPAGISLVAVTPSVVGIEITAAPSPAETRAQESTREEAAQ